jgi:hypothetical protein
MPLERPELRLRCLPEGLPHAGFHRGLRGNLLQVELVDRAGDLAAGSLVEVDWEQTLYLGQVYSQENGILLIGVEHVVDREPLSAIRDIWSPNRN